VRVLRGAERSAQSLDLGFGLGDARLRRFLGNDVGRLHPTFLSARGAHPRVVRRALENFERRPAHEIVEWAVARVLGVVNPEAQHVRDVGRLGA
jgi:hypothetical protein